MNLALGHIGVQKPILEDHCTVVNTEMPVRRVLVLSLGLGYESQTAFLHNCPASAVSELELQINGFITVSINHYFSNTVTSTVGFPGNRRIPIFVLYGFLFCF